jgi:hypothetical protein
LDTRIRCRALRDERRLLATKARHVLRRRGTLVRKYGKLVHVVIPSAASREVVGLALVEPLHQVKYAADAYIAT